VETAMRLFSKLGIRRVSVDDICREMQMSKKTLYTLFPTKEAIIIELLHSRNEEMNQYFLKTLQGKNALEALLIIIKNIIKFSNTNEGIVREDIMKYYPKIFDEFTRIFSVKFRNGFEENLRQGIAEGFYREDLDIEILSSFQTLSARYSQKRELEQELANKFTKKRVTEFFFDMFVRCIVNERGLQFYNDNYLKKQNENAAVIENY